MKVSDLAHEYKTTSDAVLLRLKALRLKAKDADQEINAAVLSVLRSELSKGNLPPAPPPRGVTKPKWDREVKEKVVAKSKPAAKTAKAKAPAKEKAVAKSSEKEKKAVKAVSKAKSAAKAPVAKEKPTKAVAEVKEKAVKAPAPILKAPAPVAAPKPVAPIEQKKIEPPVVSAPKVEPPKVVQPAPAPIAQKPKSRISDQPFESVKPLAKKKRRPGMHDLHPAKPDARPGAAVKTPEELALEAATPAAPVDLKELELELPIAVKDFAFRIQEKASVVLKKLLQLGVFANINQHLDEGLVQKLAQEFGYNLKVKTEEQQLVEVHNVEKDDPDKLKPRAPVVTFMGHVDHGKTSLIDRIRKAKVADSEHGGITQHIGAYSVTLPKGRITFLDTPGHEAFTAMRARGAHITDLVVLVVAADEGIMPQTEEAIDHARAANVPIVVALNKIDKPSANPDKVKKQLATHNLATEDWGGRTVCVGVSAITGEGIDQLLEMILLEAELLELKANPDKKATGIIVEAHLSQGRGPVASLIVQNGTLHEGDAVLVGSYYGKVKALFDDRERPIKEAGPSMPAEILGLPAVPEAGEIFYVMADEKHAREIAYKRRDQIKEHKLHATSKITLEDLYSQIQEGKLKELNVIIKADVQGSLEAIKDSLLKIPSDQIRLNFIHTGVGEINASDIILAVASSAIIIGFQVEINTRAKEELEKQPVDVRTYRIIYDAVNDIRNALEGLLEPKLRKKFMSRIEIREVFKLTRGIIAGCFVQKGRVVRKANIDIMRNGEIVFSGNIGSLKRFKDDVKDVAEGMECGIIINNYDQIEVGDVIEAYEVEKIARKL